MTEQQTISVLNFPQLPYYLTVKKVTDYSTDTVKVLVESKIHANKAVELPMQFSIGFVQARPREFEGDILGYIVKRYGLKLQSTKYE